MVLAYHVIIGAYGFWLPNDRRGSWSDFVGCWELLRFGRATTVDARHSLARQPFDPAVRAAARALLKYPAVKFTGLQARAIVRGFATCADASGLTLWACAVLGEHIHLVLARHRMKVEQQVIQLKGAATRQLSDENIHPLAAFPTRSGRLPKAFARDAWHVYLDTPADILRAIRYVNDNPRREGCKPQSWNCVRPYTTPV